MTQTNTNIPRQFYRRKLPSDLIDFSSEEGKKYFSESLENGHMNCYFFLAAQLITQDEPAYCGISTLVMVLNALEIDPGKVWKGAWRWYHESMLDCCVPLEVVKEKGITFGQFVGLANCNNLSTMVVRVDENSVEESFRDCVHEYTRRDDAVIVVSYSRSVLQQTGDGHFSTIGGYHRSSDRVLILDTARFKYPPHWVRMSNLFAAMKTVDKETGLSRGYMIVKRRKDIKHLVIFKLSNSLSVFCSSITNKIFIEFFNKWRNGLLQREEFKTTEDSVVMADVCRLLLRVVSSTSTPVTLFKTQAILDEHSLVLQSCKAFFTDAISDLRKCPLYKTLSDIVNDFEPANGINDLEARLKLFGDSSILNEAFPCTGNSDCCVMDLDFLLMFILCWPYRVYDGSYSKSVATMVQGQLQNFGEVICNEIAIIKNQLTILLEVWREGVGINACNMKRCCFSS